MIARGARMSAHISARAKPAPIGQAHGVHASMRAPTRENFSLHAPYIKTLTRVYAPVHPVRSVRCAGSRRALTCALARLPRALSPFSMIKGQQMTEAAKKPSFTEAFPVSAGVIGEFYKAFGADQVARNYIEEGGRSIGKPLDESRYTVITGKDLIVAKPQRGKA